MIELVREDDFAELPKEPDHSWLQLEKLARARLMDCINSETNLSITQLKEHYMHVVKQLATDFKVEGIVIPPDGGIETQYDKFLLAVTRSQARIWAGSYATFPLGRATLNSDVKKKILELTHEIEIQIHDLDDSDRRRIGLLKRLEDFRREINQPKTRVGVALTTLAQLSTVVAMTTASLAQGPDAYATIQQLLGAEHLVATGSEIQLIEQEKTPLVAQIEGPKPVFD